MGPDVEAHLGPDLGERAGEREQLAADLDGVAGHPDVGAPAGLYHDGSGLTAADVISVDPAAAAKLHGCLLAGDMALRQFAPGAVPVLWPEHFDVGVTVDEVNYGVSLGDGFLNEPYAYVGPPTSHKGAFWNAPFGAALPLPGKIDEIAAFFAKGQGLTGEGATTT
jgi:hypothetical protein